MKHPPFPSQQSQQTYHRTDSELFSKLELTTQISTRMSSTTGYEIVPRTTMIANIQQPATTFMQFPRLPLEIRQIIWRACLPPKNRVLPVKVMRADNSSSKFKSCCSHSAYAHASDLRMLEVCHESRTEYLSANPKFLPGVRDAKLYYNPEATIIYLTNFGGLRTVLRPSEIAHIQTLAVFCPNKSDFGYPDRVYTFSNLKELKCVVGWTPKGFDHRRYCQEICTNITLELEMYKAVVESSKSVPRVSILEGMP